MKFLFSLVFLLALNFLHAQKTTKPLPDSTQIKNIITSFYNWYNANWKEVTAFKLYKGKVKDGTPPYIIDWKEVERYFAFLRKNAPSLSEAFIENERASFKKSEKEFKKHPKEEMPSGFEYDHFTESQEEPGIFIKELLKKDNKWAITFLPGGKAHLLVLYTEGDVFSCADLVKVKGVWKITSVACESGGQ